LIAGGGVTRAVRGVDPVCFAMVMATGIVSAALRQVGLPVPSAVLLAIAAAVFVILVVTSCWRAAVFPADLRADLMCPDRAFASFAFVAACAVLGNGLAVTGHRYAAAVLAGMALAAWLALTCLIPVRLAARRRARPRISGVNGTWYLWAVGTQSLAIAAAFLRSDGLLQPRLAAAAGIAVWSAGIVVYLAVMGLVLARLRLAGLGPADDTAPYWVAMGAASISTFAAARILLIAGAPAVAAARPAVTSVAVILWAVATALIPVLVTVTAVRWPRPPFQPRFRPQTWAIVFPLGMYAVAGLGLGRATRLPLIQHIGTAAVWPAAAAWTLTFTVMAASPFTRRRDGARPSRATPQDGVTRPSQSFQSSHISRPSRQHGRTGRSLK
jgi:tellurite resistance protein TehA-like permease